MRPGDRLICAFVETKGVGEIFKDWPLHITIVPWFRLEVDSNKLAEELRRAYIGGGPFDIKVLGEAHFGYKQRKQVNLADAPMLMRLEGQTRRLLHAYKAWVVDEADKTRKRPFKPHITVQHADRLHQGDNFQCDRFFIVSQRGDYKQIDSDIIL